MFLCADLLFVQNQVNRPRFSRHELEVYIADQEKRRRAAAIADESFRRRPMLSPRELVTMARAAKRGKKIKFTERIKRDLSV